MKTYEQTKKEKAVYYARAIQGQLCRVKIKMYPDLEDIFSPAISLQEGQDGYSTTAYIKHYAPYVVDILPDNAREKAQENVTIHLVRTQAVQLQQDNPEAQAQLVSRDLLDSLIDDTNIIHALANDGIREITLVPHYVGYDKALGQQAIIFYLNQIQECKEQ